MRIKIVEHSADASPAGKLCDAEIHFDNGPLAGLKLIGFGVWERRGPTGRRNVTFPARTYSVNGERRSFALLRPIEDHYAQDRVRDAILEAFTQFEATRAIGAYSTMDDCIITIPDRTPSAPDYHNTPAPAERPITPSDFAVVAEALGTGRATLAPDYTSEAARRQAEADDAEDLTRSAYNAEADAAAKKDEEQRRAISDRISTMTEDEAARELSRIAQRDAQQPGGINIMDLTRGGKYDARSYQTAAKPAPLAFEF